MIQGYFSEFKKKQLKAIFFFVNVSQPNKYRFYRRRKTWDEYYMVEFYSNSDNYHLESQGRFS